jgi:hypothetical protein
MDKRVTLLEEIYSFHQRLADIFHSSAEDNLLLAEFCKAFTQFVAILKPIPNSNRIGLIFKSSPDLHDRKQLMAHMIAAADYTENIASRISADPTIQISNEFIAIVFDFDKLLKAISTGYNLPQNRFVGNRNMKVDSYTSFKIAGKFFWCPSQLQRSNMTNGYTIFALRQALELAGQELLGLSKIVDEYGETDKYAAQIPWQFIVANEKQPFLNLTFNAADIQKIYKWTNHFVHTGTDAFCWVNGLALQTAERIYISKKITYWDGQQDFVYANEISNYLLLKQSFEKFVLTIKRKPRFAVWAPTSKLAHITLAGARVPRVPRV